METKHFIIVIILLCLSYVGIQFFGKIEDIQTSELLPEDFPAEMNGWSGTDIPVSDVEKNFLPEDTLFVKKIYRKAGVGEVFLVVVFSGKDRRSIHRPEVCYPSQGWSIQDKTTAMIDIEHPITALKATRLDVNYVKNNNTSSDVVLYWFMGNNRITSSHFKRVLLMGYDRCVKGRNYRWAFLRVSATVSPNNKDATLGVLKQFVVDLFPHIVNDEYRQY
ncbi:EpsI family protein [bacterium]|nr:EpsI family protein [bacterium]MCP5462663.1 EpsI family protein [bacterium]